MLVKKVVGMYCQLFKENMLGQVIVKMKRVQYINFIIELVQVFDEGIVWQVIEIIFLFKGLYQGIFFFFDLGKVVEWCIVQVEVYFM